ncbi:hypothetical protein ACTXT7_013671 [Hymenolepis weldensis]
MEEGRFQVCHKGGSMTPLHTPAECWKNNYKNQEVDVNNAIRANRDVRFNKQARKNLIPNYGRYIETGSKAVLGWTARPSLALRLIATYCHHPVSSRKGKG